MSLDFAAGRPSAGAGAQKHCELQCCCSPSSTTRRPQLSRNAVSEYFTPRHFELASAYECSFEADDESDEQPDENVSIEKLFGDLIDPATFEQILEMDDDEDEREFSKSIVYDFFDQAANTFKQMHQGLKDKDLEVLSSLGHFLKGSSATLGLNKVKDSCEKIQHFGARKDETGNKDVADDKESLRNCEKYVKQAEKDFKDAERVLQKFFHEDVPESSTEDSSAAKKS
ncbi:hypothetical protein CBER1_09398 [Cercospora berteroae]|uniref:HPt domain-containing protein n=1 Tax=Cercospora berteroae TaxID=357750 RepID=A0A2S6C963_9PEZI|nr:hypothetical protein CBER1_09398 [Cercospora berteroae]